MSWPGRSLMRDLWDEAACAILVLRGSLSDMLLAR